MCYCCIYIFEENLFIYYYNSNMQYTFFFTSVDLKHSTKERFIYGFINDIFRGTLYIYIDLD